MNLSTHLAVGAAVGYATRNPVLGFFAGIISHHLIDQIPHTDGGSLQVSVDNFIKDKRIIAIVLVDLVMIAVVAFLLLRAQGYYWPMILGGFGGTLPDLVDNMPFWTPRLRKLKPFKYYHKLHEFFHYTIMDEDYLWMGVVVQLFLIGAVLAILL